ncbi:hypothetical protein NUH88_09975 [Nisaea acidiphila]|uniref:Lipoprotein n=1 Tax=Nisaea acidiphila TaxID=1862145 RepID=A0A9J7B0K8_9PROT|nr:hypothetical protein [Nisaea acidiphila]UUX52012.1 hypothetical protein NUH88_09975 [Nisaea acidiphila]
MARFWKMSALCALLAGCVTIEEATGAHADLVRQAAYERCVIVSNPGRARSEKWAKPRPPIVYKVEEGHDGWLRGDVTLHRSFYPKTVRDNVYVNQGSGEVICGSSAWQARFGRGFY